MRKGIPVYDIKAIAGSTENTFLASRFLPYYTLHHNLHHAHRHNFYHILLFTEGKGKHAIDFETFPVEPYQIYFMSPGQVHHWDFEGHVDGYVVNFSSDFFQSFFLRSDFLDDFDFFRGDATASVFQIPIESRGKIVGLFKDILTEDNGNPDGITMQRLLLRQLFISVSRLSENGTFAKHSSYGQTLLATFQKLISSHFVELKLPKAYASLMYITPNHLNKVCNDLLGISAGEVIRRRVVLEAKRHLINPDLSVADVARLLNFADNSYFTKSFKKQAGLTPEQFRKQLITS